MLLNQVSAELKVATILHTNCIGWSFIQYFGETFSQMVIAV